MRFVLRDRIEQGVGRAADAGDAGDAQAGDAGVVAADRIDLGEVDDGAGAELTGCLVLDWRGQLVGVGRLEHAAGDLGGKGDSREIAQLGDGLAEGAALQVDQPRQTLGERGHRCRVLHPEAGAIGDSLAYGFAGQVVELVGASQADVTEEDAEGAGAVKRVESVQVAADAVTRDDLVFGLDRDRGKDLASLADAEDIFDLDVLPEVVQEVDQRGVLHWGVAGAVDAKQRVVVAADDGAVLGGLERTVRAHEEAGALVGCPVQAGNGERFAGGDVLGDHGADAADQGIDGVPLLFVAAINHGAFAVSGESSGDAVCC